MLNARANHLTPRTCGEGHVGLLLVCWRSRLVLRNGIVSICWLPTSRPVINMAIFGDSDCLNVAQHVAEVVLSEVVTVFCIWALSRHAMRQGGLVDRRNCNFFSLC